jgi:hypothetical protein
MHQVLAYEQLVNPFFMGYHECDLRYCALTPISPCNSGHDSRCGGILDDSERRTDSTGGSISGWEGNCAGWVILCFPNQLTLDVKLIYQCSQILS